MKLVAHHWPAISALLDEALDLAPEQRDAWLEALLEPARAHRDTLASLLADRARVETQDFMRTLPKLALAEEPEQSDVGDAPRMIGPYRLLREIGRGGMGSVWLAERSDGVLKRPVALKLPHPGLATRSFAERLARERDILASLAHPHIARLYDAGVTPDGQPFIALEYVAGRSLIEHCDEARLELRARIELFLQVLAAVQYAHAHLVIHRDLKPSNVLVDEQGQVRLLDFGIAKLMVDGRAEATELTLDAGHALTPDYASPEQIAGNPITIASDVYSLGVMLFELLAGQRPYKLSRGSRAELETAILGVDPLRPSQSAKDPGKAHMQGLTAKKLQALLRGDLDTVVLKAIRKEPQARYATANAFAADLDRYLKAEPVTAHPDGTWYRARKFLRRNKLAVGTAAAVVMALATGLGAALWEARVAETEARTARAVETFLGDIFRANSSAHPDPLKARETSARELLDLGARRVDTELRDAPRAKIRVLATLADMYDELGLRDQASALAKTRVTLTRAEYGGSDPRLAEALTEFANNVYGSLSDTKEARAALAEADRIFTADGDSTSRARGQFYWALAQHLQSGDLTGASEAATKGVTILRAYPSSYELAQALTMQGILSNARKEYREAAVMLSEAAALTDSLQGKPKRELPIIYAYLGEAQNNLLDLAGAEASYRTALHAAQSLRGPEHVDTVQTQVRLGNFLFNNGKAPEGLELMRSANELVMRTHGASDDFHAPYSLSMYGRALVKFGRVEEGNQFLVQAIERRRKKRSGTRQLAQMLEWHAAALTDLGRYAEADAALNEAAGIRAKVGDTLVSGLLNTAVLTRADLLLATDRPEDAAQLIASLPSPSDGVDGISRNALEVTLMNAQAEIARGQPAVAIELAAHARRRIEASPLRGFLAQYEARAALAQGQAQLLAHHADAALEALKRSAALSATLYDQSSPAMAQVEIALAECHLALGETDRARTAYAAARKVQAAHTELAPQFQVPLHAIQARLAADASERSASLAVTR